MRESEGDAAVGRNGLCQDCRRAFCVEFCFVFFLSFFLRRRRPIQLLSAAGGVEEPTGPGGGGGGGMKTAPRVNNRRRNSRVPTENKRFRLTVVDCGDHNSDGLLCHFGFYSFSVATKLLCIHGQRRGVFFCQYVIIGFLFSCGVGDEDREDIVFLLPHRR